MELHASNDPSDDTTSGWNDSDGDENDGNEPISEMSPYSKIEGSSYTFGYDDEAIDATSLNPLRLFGYIGLALTLSLGSNFLGITTGLLSTAPTTVIDAFRSTGLDQVIPVAGFKKYIYRTNTEAYEFLYPEEWLADQTIEREKIMARELPNSLQEKRRQRVGPQAAFGPARSDGRENVSLIKSRVMPGFELEKTLGAPRQAAERLLSTVVAAPNSGKAYQLIDAYADTRDGRPAYVFEYTVRKDEKVDNPKIRQDFFVHSVSVIMGEDEDLYTLTAVVPEESWLKNGDMVKTMARSFKLS